MARSSACLKIQKCSAHFALLTRSRCSRSLVLVRGCITKVVGVWRVWRGELTRTQWFAVSFGWFLVQPSADCAVTLCNKEFSWPLERLRLPSEDILIESVAEKDDDASADAEEDADLRYLGSCVRIKCGSLCPC